MFGGLQSHIALRNKANFVARHEDIKADSGNHYQYRNNAAIDGGNLGITIGAFAGLMTSIALRKSWSGMAGGMLIGSAVGLQLGYLLGDQIGEVVWYRSACRSN
jgi:hypothetical protein